MNRKQTPIQISTISQTMKIVVKITDIKKQNAYIKAITYFSSINFEVHTFI